MSEDIELDAGEQVLLARLRELPRTLEPRRDLWPAVLAAVNGPGAPRRLLLARAAGLVAMLGTALAVGLWTGYDFGQRKAVPVAALGPGVEVGRIELAYAAARESYLREIALGGNRLDPASRKALRSQLAVIDRAVHELRAAMDADPGNAIYIDTLLMTREREMELLADISGATTTRL